MPEGVADNAGNPPESRPGLESGFSLVELLVVVVIVGILTSIAIPTFVGQREQAHTAAVQTDLRNAATAATACSAANDGLYEQDVTCNLETLEKSYGFAPTDNVVLTDGTIEANRWSASAVYTGQPDTLHHFDTSKGSQVREGELKP